MMAAAVSYRLATPQNIRPVEIIDSDSLFHLDRKCSYVQKFIINAEENVAAISCALCSFYLRFNYGSGRDKTLFNESHDFVDLLYSFRFIQ